MNNTGAGSANCNCCSRPTSTKPAGARGLFWQPRPSCLCCGIEGKRMRLETARAGWRNLDPWERVALTAWGVLVLVVCSRALAWPHSHSLYPVFVTAARNWQAAEPLYDAAHQATANLD